MKRASRRRIIEAGGATSSTSVSTPPCPLMKISQDALKVIVSFLSHFPDLARYRRLNRRFFQACSEPLLWRKLILKNQRLHSSFLGHLELIFGWASWAIGLVDLRNSRVDICDILSLLQRCGTTLISLSLGSENFAIGHLNEFNPDLLNECFALCPHLQQLTLCVPPRNPSHGGGLEWESLDSHFFPRLTTIRLHNVGFGDHLILSFLVRLPYLQSLCVFESNQFGLSGHIKVSKAAWFTLAIRCPYLAKMELTGVGTCSTLVRQFWARSSKIRCFALHNAGSLHTSALLLPHQLPSSSQNGRPSSPLLPDDLLPFQPLPVPDVNLPRRPSNDGPTLRSFELLTTFVCSETTLSMKFIVALVENAPLLSVIVAESITDAKTELTPFVNFLVSNLHLAPKLTTLVLDHASISPLISSLTQHPSQTPGESDHIPASVDIMHHPWHEARLLVGKRPTIEFLELLDLGWCAHHEAGRPRCLGGVWRQVCGFPPGPNSDNAQGNGKPPAYQQTFCPPEIAKINPNLLTNSSSGRRWFLKKHY